MKYRLQSKEWTIKFGFISTEYISITVREMEHDKEAVYGSSQFNSSKGVRDLDASLPRQKSKARFMPNSSKREFKWEIKHKDLCLCGKKVSTYMHLYDNM